MCRSLKIKVNSFIHISTIFSGKSFEKVVILNDLASYDLYEHSIPPTHPPRQLNLAISQLPVVQSEHMRRFFDTQEFHAAMLSDKAIYLGSV